MMNSKPSANCFFIPVRTDSSLGSHKHLFIFLYIYFLNTVSCTELQEFNIYIFKHDVPSLSLPQNTVPRVCSQTSGCTDICRNLTCISWPNSIALLLHLFLQIRAPLLQRVCHSPRVNFERPFVKMLATSRSIVCAELPHFRGGEPEPGSAMVPPKWDGAGSDHFFGGPDGNSWRV